MEGQRWAGEAALTVSELRVTVQVDEAGSPQVCLRWEEAGGCSAFVFSLLSSFTCLPSPLSPFFLQCFCTSCLGLPPGVDLWSCLGTVTLHLPCLPQWPGWGCDWGVTNCGFVSVSPTPMLCCASHATPLTAPERPTCPSASQTHPVQGGQAGADPQPV